MDTRPQDDPNYVPSMDEFWADVDANITAERQRPKHRVTPHSALKHKCRAALTAWRQRLGLPIVLLPSFVGTVTASNGRDYPVGKKGQADDTILVLGVAVACEYKFGADQQSEHQRRFQERWEAAGGIYVLCRKPSDLTDALSQVAAQRGLIF